MSSQIPSDKKTSQSHRDQNAPHIGGVLRNYLHKKGIPATHLAKKINRNHSTIFSYFKHQSIQIHILWEISHALKYNFFADIAMKLPADFAKAESQESKELKRLRIENDVLKELLKR